MTEPGGPPVLRTVPSGVGAGTGTDACAETTVATTVAWPPEFVALYQDRYEAMVRYATLLVSSKERAEELAQEAFLLLHRNWDRVDHPRAYLRTTVTNLCRSYHRRHALEVRRRPAPPDHAVLGADEMSDAIAGLPFRQRAVVVLRFYEDLPETEIAQLLGCATGTVASSLHRALARLRKEMAS